MKNINSILLLLIIMLCGRAGFAQDNVEFEEQSENTDPTVYAVVEQMPEYPGGMTELKKFLSTHLIYPAESRRKGEEGTVFVGFVVGTDGKINDVRTIKGVSALIDAEAERVIRQMPEWKPGMQDGKKVKVKFVLPLNFKLPEAAKKTD